MAAMAAAFNTQRIDGCRLWCDVKNDQELKSFCIVLPDEALITDKHTGKQYKFGLKCAILFPPSQPPSLVAAHVQSFLRDQIRLSTANVVQTRAVFTTISRLIAMPEPQAKIVNNVYIEVPSFETLQQAIYDLKMTIHDLSVELATVKGELAAAKVLLADNGIPFVCGRNTA